MRNLISPHLPQTDLIRFYMIPTYTMAQPGVNVFCLFSAAYTIRVRIEGRKTRLKYWRNWKSIQVRHKVCQEGIFGGAENAGNCCRDFGWLEPIQAGALLKAEPLAFNKGYSY